MRNTSKKVLIACEFSGVVRDAFLALGYDTWSCDLLPTERPGPHIQGDVLKYLEEGWDLMIGHPPCTYLTNSGVQFLKREGRFELMKEGSIFLRRLLEAPIKQIAIENPIPHKYAVSFIGRKYDQIIQPYHFGYLESKATVFWLKNLPRLIHTTELKAETLVLPEKIAQRNRYEPKGPERWKNRSRFLPGIASAMASQWGPAS